jgi:hypothetical protein
MTEAEWLTSDDPRLLVDWLFFDALATDRKLRLFSVACCEPLRRLVADSGVLAALDLAEAFADERIDEAAFAAARRPLWDAFHARRNAPGWFETVSAEADDAECACLHTTLPEVPRDRDGHSDLYPPVPEVVALICRLDSSRSSFRRLITLLHEVFGPLPFGHIAFSPEWRTDTAVLLARQMYDARDLSAMPILADALQDAGCDNDDILTHCRGPGPHVMGCWVVDLVLGKE